MFNPIQTTAFSDRALYGSQNSLSSLASDSSLLSTISTDTASSTQSTDTIRQRPQACYGGEWDLRLSAAFPRASLKVIQNFEIDDHNDMLMARPSGSQPSERPDPAASDLNHAESHFKVTLDDVTEMHFKPGSLDEIKADTDSYSQYLTGKFKTDMIGGQENLNHGLHIHIDIEKTFHSARSLGRFFTVLFNVAPVLAKASRVNPDTNVRAELNDSQIKAAQTFLDGIANEPHDSSEKTKRDEVMKDLKHALCGVSIYEKFYDVNLEHEHFGEEGTIELRSLQSPQRPEDIHTLISLIDKMVEFAQYNPEHPVTQKIQPQQYSNIYQVLDLFCNDDLPLRHKLESLFEAHEVKPVQSVALPPDHWVSQLAFACKKNDLEEVEILLTLFKPLRFDINGTDPYVYAEHHQFNGLARLLQQYNIQPLDTVSVAADRLKIVRQAEALGFNPLHRLRLMRHPEDLVAKVLKARTEKVSATDAKRLLQMSPRAHETYDLMLQKGMQLPVALRLLPYQDRDMSRIHEAFAAGFSAHDVEAIQYRSPEFSDHEFQIMLNARKEGMDSSDIFGIMHTQNAHMAIEAFKLGFSSYDTFLLLASMRGTQLKNTIQARINGFSTESSRALGQELSDSQAIQAFSLKALNLYTDNLCIQLAAGNISIGEIPLINSFKEKGFSDHDAIWISRMNLSQHEFIHQALNFNLSGIQIMKVIDLSIKMRLEALNALKAGYAGPVVVAIAKGMLNDEQKELSLRLKKAGVRPSNCLHYVRDNSTEEIEFILRAMAAGLNEDEADDLLIKGLVSATAALTSSPVAVSA